LLTSAAGAPRLDPDRWLAAAPETKDSWWPAWDAWLNTRSGSPISPPPLGVPGSAEPEDAPGRYVLEK
jgi:polyhydroxyalkanoate synthase